MSDVQKVEQNVVIVLFTSLCIFCVYLKVQVLSQPKGEIGY